jgi:hypothetical protein
MGGMKSWKTSGARFILWMAVYVVAVAVLSLAFNLGLVPPALAIPLALAPMVPAILAALAKVDGFRELDELQRKIQSEGILFAFVITAVVTFSYGFLEVYAGFPRLSMFFVWPVLAMGWMAGATLASRRYA